MSTRDPIHTTHNTEHADRIDYDVIFLAISINADRTVCNVATWGCLVIFVTSGNSWIQFPAAIGAFIFIILELRFSRLLKQLRDIHNS